MPALTRRSGLPASCPSTALLRTLQLHLLALHAHSPYSGARLARIADQLEYVLRHWPADQWPVMNRHSGQVPDRLELLHSVASLSQQVAASNEQHTSPWPLHAQLVQLLKYIL